MGLWVFFGVHDAAATRGQYLASSKAWLSCCQYDNAQLQITDCLQIALAGILSPVLSKRMQLN